MSWFGHTLLPVIQDIFWNRVEPDPKKAASIVREHGCLKEADFIEKMTPDNWLETCRWACTSEAD